MTDLESRYRRLVAGYPREHRDEMLGVLLAGASRHARPGIGETLDLWWGAARLHLRRVVTSDGMPFRNVLAGLALLGPIAMLLGATSALHMLWRIDSLATLTRPAAVMAPAAPGRMWQWWLPDLPVWGIWFAVAVLAVCRLRRTAAIGAWLGTIGLLGVPLIDPDPSSRWLPWHAGSVVAGIAVSAALTWSPGPARGWELLGGKRFTLFAGVVAATVGLFALAPVGSGEAALTSTGSVLLIGGAVIAGGTRSRTVRRVVLLIAPIVLPAVLRWALPLNPTTVALAAIWYAVLVITVVLIGTPRSVR